MPKTLIIDLDRDTSTYNPTGQATSTCKQETIQTKETQGISKKHKVWSPKVFKKTAQYS